MNTDEKIRASAYRLFVSRGFSCPTAAITKDAGVSNGVLFKYYPTKNDLIVQLYIDVRRAYFQEAQSVFGAEDITPDNYIATLKGVWLHQIDWSLANWEEFAYMRFFEDSELYKSLDIRNNECIRKIDEFLEDQISRSVEMGFTRRMDPGFMACIGNAISVEVIRYLHASPAKRKDPVFMEQAWEAYFSAMGL